MGHHGLRRRVGAHGEDVHSGLEDGLGKALEARRDVELASHHAEEAQLQRRAVGSDAPWAETVLNADAGGVVAFAGKARHGGMQITAGTRYIIPLFCFVDENRSGKAPGYVVEGLG